MRLDLDLEYGKPYPEDETTNNGAAELGACCSSRLCTSCTRPDEENPGN
jgi:hypothetical protein